MLAVGLWRQVWCEGQGVKVKGEEPTDHLEFGPAAGGSRRVAHVASCLPMGAQLLTNHDSVELVALIANLQRRRAALRHDQRRVASSLVVPRRRS